MLETADQDLADLGPVPEDVRAIVTRILGDTPLTLAHADELLASLSDGAAIPTPSFALPTPSVFETESPSKVLEMLESEPPASMPAPAAAAAAPAAAPTAVPSEPRPAIVAAPESEAPPASETPSEPPQLTAAARRRAEWEAAMMDSQPAGPLASEPPPAAAERHDSEPVLSFEADTDLSEPPPRQETGHAPERKLEGEATAQAIVAAFDDPELDAAIAQRRSSADDPRVTLESAPPDDYVPSPASDYPRRPGRHFERGSRRPDLDKLLDQPLDALDFERSEPLPESRAAGGSDAPVSNPPAAAAADDFEILVDDEILEIAEDEVELVDEDSSS